MRSSKKSFAAGAGALVTAAALVLGGSAAAFAAAPLPAPDSSDVVITKVKQPDALGTPTNGVEQTGLVADQLIDGVTFQAYRVPGTGAGEPNDIGTNSGQRAAALVKLSDAQTAINAADPAIAPVEGTTGDAGLGQIRWNDLPRGLYLVKEDLSSLPAGVTASAPFLLAVPMTDPVKLNEWLDTIYVYPKNSVVSGAKTVSNADQLTVGETITWTITTDIPLVQNPDFKPGEPVGADNLQFIAPDAYRIDDTLQDAQLALAPAYAEGANTGITVTVGGGVGTLTEGTDYTVTEVAAAGTSTYQIALTTAGRAKLATAVNADTTAQVVVTLDTTVVSAQEITNGAHFYPNQNAVDTNKPVTVTPSQVKYGSIQVTKRSTDAELTSWAGAQFQVFASKEDAEEQKNALVPDVEADYYDAATGTWTTPADGVIVIEGLRFSNFANGEQQLPFLDADGNQTDDPAQKVDDNPLYQKYWLVEVKALEGHQLLAEPIEFVIESTTATVNAFTVTNTSNNGGFVLPLTGGTGTVLLTVAGIAILAIVLLVARRRREAVAAE